MNFSIHLWRQAIFEDQTLSADGKLLAYTLAMYYRDEAHEIWPGLPALSMACNRVVNTIRKAILELESAGYITRRRERRMAMQSCLSTIYNFMMPAALLSPDDSANDSANDSAWRDSKYREYREVKDGGGKGGAGGKAPSAPPPSSKNNKFWIAKMPQAQCDELLDRVKRMSDDDLAWWLGKCDDPQERCAIIWLQDWRARNPGKKHPESGP
jgi:hypothetical protein